MTFTPEQVKSLQAPLATSNVKAREQGGRQVSYVEGWHVIAEANRIFGFDGWDRETILLQETNRDLVTLNGNRGEYQQWRIGYIAKVRVTVGGIVREGTGYGSGMGRPEAIGDAVEGAIKEAETDAMKRALMTFGNPFGLALYDKAQTNVADEQQLAARKVADGHKAAFAGATTVEQLKVAWDAALKDKDQFSLPIQQELRAAMMDRKIALTPADDFPGDQPKQAAE